MSEFINLYKDAAATQQIFPRTQIEAIEGLYELFQKSRPKNLLDNSDFTNPVNQRGQSSYTEGYSIDRWGAGEYSAAGSLSISKSGLTLTPGDAYMNIYQRIDNDSLQLTGKSMTFAANIDNSIMILNFTFGTNKTAVNGTNSLIHWDNDMLIRCSATATVKWAALYEGTYTIVNLPEYQPKDCSVELAECQRYYYRTSPGALNGYITSEAKRIYLDITLPSMRATPRLTNPLPILTIRTVTGYSPVAGNTEPYGTPASQNISIYNKMGGNSTIYFDFDAEIGTNNTPVNAQLRNNSYLEFSADL